ncbi:hypothetical protein PGTUg99_013686 [Puccinia graminis f. sp. tritici]|uniref:DUF6589 domain-containing protein n=1 Tax=Puccinia graminis f. sp. tritici TaxID=56615 RepID=A0A5B0SI05_PUCGR|nr:hypothetical protein PGTUg99_013686 [Puccinia graminis f. sp. tritici]
MSSLMSCTSFSVVMKTQYQEAAKTKITISSEQWNHIVDACYKQFCSPEARSAAARDANPKLSNTLIMLHDFSSVVEAKRAMQAGDIGRLMIVWKKWCIMTQGLKGLTNYSS